MIGTRVEFWPRLTRFYGLDPVMLSNLPRWVVDLYIDNLASLEAEEQLGRLQAADYPHVSDRDREKTHRQLVRMADMEPQVASLDIGALTKGDESPAAALAAMGIKAVVE